MINRFRNKFGTKEEVVLGWGNWSEGSPMKWLEPTKGIGMRKLFTRMGYEVLLVDEYRTSCRCYGCEGGKCVKFKQVEDFGKEKIDRWSYEMLSCENCKRLRDRNGSLNILRCAKVW